MDQIYAQPLGPEARWVGSGDGEATLIFVKMASKSYKSINKEKYDDDDDDDDDGDDHHHQMMMMMMRKMTWKSSMERV